MRDSKSRKYKNYGPIPQNEYSADPTEKSADSAAPLEGEPQANDTAYKQRLVARQSRHPAAQRRINGWTRSWKANGWRAEAAAQDDEL